MCLDYVFNGKLISCLVNLYVCYELMIIMKFVEVVKIIVVVGVGFVGLVVVMMVV